ncbi:MAG: hypothetical protein M0R66_07440 [Candidatus Omnitrophica bacterium]|nr:hypothetical protein [Candidatus Omnitrophota bacterium]
MSKVFIFLMIIGLSVLFFVPLGSAQTQSEQLTITTYYPSPYGSYRELTAYQMKIGSTYSAAATSFVNNALLVEGRIGAGVATPQNNLDVEGGAVVGAGYSGTSTAPTNGLLVEGNVGIGVASVTNAQLEVQGRIKSNTGSSAGRATCWTANNTLGFCSDTPTGGACTCN